MEKEKDQIESMEGSINTIKVGEVFLSSNELSMDSLAGLLIQLLKEKPIKEYLDLLKTKQKLNGGGYLG